MNNRYVHKKIKKTNKPKSLRQLFASAIIFIFVVVLSKNNVLFREKVIKITESNTNYTELCKFAFEKIEQCYKQYTNYIEEK